MEQPCYKCGEPVEEGTPFCTHCSAPQIRVVLAERVHLPGADAVMQSPGQPVVAVASPRPTVPLRFGSMIRPCILAALLAALSMILGLAFPAAAIGAGFLAAALYRWRTAGAVRVGLGAQLGALTGALSFGILAAFLALASTVPDVRSRLHDQVIDSMQKAAASRPDPRVEVLIERIKTPEGFLMILIAGGVVLFVFCLILGILGGALGGAILSRRDHS